MSRPGSNVTLLQREGKRRPSVFVDCVAMTGVVSAEYDGGQMGDMPTMTIKVLMPNLGYGKPRVRRKCLTRPHVPATGGFVVSGPSYLVGENTTDYTISHIMARQMGLIR